MHIVRIGSLILVMTMLLVFADGCKSLALTGSRKYKVDLTNACLNIQNEIEQDGAVKQQTADRLGKVLTKYEPEFGKKGSWTQSKKILDEVNKVIAENPPNSFQLYRSCLGQIANVNELLKTEVE
jgi:hypothetical protein